MNIESERKVVIKMILINEKLLKQYEKKGEVLYLLQIGEVENGKRLIKIGTSNNIKRRMKEHERYYKKDIYVLWFKPLKSKWTTLMKEEENKEIWKTFTRFEYQRNDRFYIPDYLWGISVKIRKLHNVSFDVMCIETK